MKNSQSDQASPPFTVAVDFDGVLVHCEYPSIGFNRDPLNYRLLSILQQAGGLTILYTLREKALLDDALLRCRRCGWDPEWVNETPTVRVERYHCSRKVGADLYVEDHALFSCQKPLPNNWWLLVLRRLASEAPALTLRVIELLPPEMILKLIQEVPDANYTTKE